MNSTRLWRSCGSRTSFHYGLQFGPVQQRPTSVARTAWQMRCAHSRISPKQMKLDRNRNPLVNPPASTRPPVLDTPNRGEFDSSVKYYFNLGKSYLRFYKDGLKAVFTNRRLLRERLERINSEDRPSVWKPHIIPKAFSRADWVLFWRVKHDVVRLPFFGLMIVVFGEFTALVVLLVDGVVPFTCRIPKQLANTQRKAEERRATAFDELEARYPHGVLSPNVTTSVGRTHVLRSLHLAGLMWDKLGFVPPGLWQIKGNWRMAFLEGDDKILVEDGGPTGLEPDELRIACSERGIDIIGKSETELRNRLGDWLRLTAAEDIAERRRRMTTLLLTRPSHWPQSRDFAVPEWHL